MKHYWGYCLRYRHAGRRQIHFFVRQIPFRPLAFEMPVNAIETMTQLQKVLGHLARRGRASPEKGKAARPPRKILLLQTGGLRDFRLFAAFISIVGNKNSHGLTSTGC